MKKLLQVFLLLTASVGAITVPAFAASGKAIVPPFDSRYGSASSYFGHSYFITNITNNPITVKISIFNQTGLMITTGLTQVSSNMTNFVLNPGDATASFTLAANNTADLYYPSSTQDCGYATISWTQDSTVQIGLIADVRELLWINNVYSFRTIAVNNNMPF